MGEQSAAEMMWTEGRQRAASCREQTLNHCIAVAIEDYAECCCLYGLDSRPLLVPFDPNGGKELSRWIRMYLDVLATRDREAVAPFAGWF